MRRKCLSPCEGAEFCILLSSCRFSICHKPVVEPAALLHQYGILIRSLHELTADGPESRTVPVRAQVLPEILDGLHIIIADHHIA